MVKKQPVLLFSIIFLAVPNILFAFFWLRWYWAMLFCACIILCVYYLRKTLQKDPAHYPNHFLITCAIGTIAWVFFSGIGGFGYQETDYLATNALHKALIEQPLPLTVTYNHNVVPVVYYVGHFLPAISIGKLLGWNTSLFTFLVWSCIGVLLVFLLMYSQFSTYITNVRQSMLVPFLFILFGGADIIGNIMNSTVQFEWWNRFVQYSGNTTLLYWVPQQAIYAWLATGICLELKQQQLTRFIPFVIALLIIYSPFAAIGLTVLFAPTVIKELHLLKDSLQHGLMKVGAIVLSVIPALFTGTYLLSNQFHITHAFLWEAHQKDFVYLWATFLCIEIIPILMVIFWIQKKLQCRLIGIIEGIGILSLVLIPLYCVGYANDFAMRVSIPALFILCLTQMKSLLILSNHTQERHIKIIISIILIIVVINGYTALYQIRRNVSSSQYTLLSPNAINTIETANDTITVEQRLGDFNTLFWNIFAK